MGHRRARDGRAVSRRARRSSGRQPGCVDRRSGRLAVRGCHRTQADGRDLRRRARACVRRVLPWTAGLRACRDRLDGGDGRRDFSSPTAIGAPCCGSGSGIPSTRISTVYSDPRTGSLRSFFDAKFHPPTLARWITLPFGLAERNRLGSEADLRDPRLALLCVFAAPRRIARARGAGFRREVLTTLRRAMPPSCGCSRSSSVFVPGMARRLHDLPLRDSAGTHREPAARARDALCIGRHATPRCARSRRAARPDRRRHRGAVLGALARACRSVHRRDGAGHRRRIRWC